MTTPSGMSREMACMASVVLPHSRSTGPRAVRGSDLHAFMCGVAKDGFEEAIANVPPEWQAAAKAIDFSRLPDLHPDACVPEVAMAYNPETGEARELGRNGTVAHEDLAELLRPGELAGIADYVSLTPSDVVCWDWKFGYSVIERAETNAQLGAYAVMAATLYGRERATVCIARIQDDGDVWVDVAHLDEMALDVHRARIRQHMRKAEEARQAYRNQGIIPTPVEGNQCRWCPAFPFCPAKMALLLSAFSNGTKEPAAIARLPEPLTEEAAANLWPKLALAEKLIERLKENVKDFARLNGGVTLANGNVLGEVEASRDTIAVDYARPPLHARFGEERIERAIKKSEELTWKALDEVLKEHSSHGRKAKLEREVVAELGEAGALRTVKFMQVKESKPKPKELKP